MIDERLTENVRAALANEPPLGFDPDELVDRAAGMRRRRRALIGSTVAAVAVLAGATVFGLSQQGGADGGVGPAATSEPRPTSSAPPSEEPTPSSPECGTAPRFYGGGAAEDALAAVAPDVLAERVPELDLTTSCVWRAGVSELEGVSASYRVDEQFQAGLRVEVRHGSIDADYISTDPNKPLLAETTLGDGSILREYGGRQSACYEEEMVPSCPSFDAVHIRPNGVVVDVNVWARVNAQTDWVAAQRDGAVALATDPRLTF
jgi:hypothetical protein